MEHKTVNPKAKAGPGIEAPPRRAIPKLDSPTAPVSTPALGLTPASNPTPLAWVLLGLLHLYRHTLGVLIPPSCRFAPSCSTYALEAVRQYGALRGAWFSAKRLARCHPFHPGGWDPVVRARDGGLR